jgi:hypothetical protein
LLPDLSIQPKKPVISWVLFVVISVMGYTL